MNSIDALSPVPVAPGDEMALSLSLSERCAAAGEHREALRHYQRYHELYALQMEQRLLAQAASVDPALLDPATGLANRAQLLERLPIMVRAAHEGATGLCVVRIALDPLQPAKGLPVGIDASVLAELGALLRANSRSKDLPCGEAGGVLTLALADVDLAAARNICERLRRAVQHHGWARLHAPLKVSLSIGLTAMRSGDAADHLLARAEAGLATARREGGNCVRAGT